MILRRADCGHYIDFGVLPTGLDHGSKKPVYLCGPCANVARGSKLEMKAVVPVGGSKVVETSRPTVIRDGEGKVIFSSPTTEVDLEKYPEFRAFTDTPPAERGRIAAIAGDDENDNPYPDKRTKEAKEWLRGFQEATATRSA